MDLVSSTVSYLLYLDANVKEIWHSVYCDSASYFVLYMRIFYIGPQYRIQFDRI
ncbi:hypothetical protein T01_15583 [Trichinella spiralis]|uniref:Uncharacterized protein n=1 Tax=Trichinella spiralis TaxID=6334 RepID=A0A0V1AJ88_TRISP|nr:hypothetical protein T01_15583 [Trichinella spiralis]